MQYPVIDSSFRYESLSDVLLTIVVHKPTGIISSKNASCTAERTQSRVASATTGTPLVSSRRLGTRPFRSDTGHSGLECRVEDRIPGTARKYPHLLHGTRGPQLEGRKLIVVGCQASCSSAERDLVAVCGEWFSLALTGERAEYGIDDAQLVRTSYLMSSRVGLDLTGAPF